MRNAFLLMQTYTLDPAIEAAPPCGERAARALCQRVASLRAAIDGARDSLPAGNPLHGSMSAALLELERLSRDVRALLDWSLPSPVRPLDCSLEEIGLAAVDAVQSDRRERTLVALESAATRVVVDGPLVSHGLARLVEHAFAGGAGRVELHIGPCGAGFAARISAGGAGDVETSLAAGLADALARRDLARLGAHVADDPEARRTVITFGPAGHRAGGPR